LKSFYFMTPTVTVTVTVKTQFRNRTHTKHTHLTRRERDRSKTKNSHAEEKRRQKEKQKRKDKRDQVRARETNERKRRNQRCRRANTNHTETTFSSFQSHEITRAQTNPHDSLKSHANEGHPSHLNPSVHPTSIRSSTHFRLDSTSSICCFLVPKSFVWFPCSTNAVVYCMTREGVM